MVREPQKPSGLKSSKPSMELRIAAFEAEMLKAHKVNFKLEAENASLRAKVKALEEELKALGKVAPTEDQMKTHLKELFDNDPKLKAYLLG
jgi:CRISPR/Cas system-associated endonuclease Cas3-HD